MYNVSMSKITEIPAFFQKYPKTQAYRLTPKAIRKELYSRPDRPNERQRYWKQVEELKSNLDSYASFLIKDKVDDLEEFKDKSAIEKFAVVVQKDDIAGAKVLAWLLINKQETISSEDTEFRKANTIQFNQVYLKNPEDGKGEFKIQFTSSTIEHVLRDKSSDKPHFILNPEEHTVQSITISFVLDGGFKVTGVNRRDNAPYPRREDYHNSIYVGDLTPADKSLDSRHTFSCYPIWFDSLEQAVGLAQESTLPISNTNLDRKEGSVYLVNRALASEIGQLQSLIQS